MSPWSFLVIGYLLTVLIEAPVLWWGLNPRHSNRVRWRAIFLLTAATYPIVILVLPPLVEHRFGRLAYVAVAETFAPVAECGLFYFGIRETPESTRLSLVRDMAAIVVANLTSFLLGSQIATAMCI